MIPAPVHDGRRLDWRPRFDPASLAYPMASGPASPLPEDGRLWTPGRVLNQGAEGACVGFGMAGEAAAEPVPVPGMNAAMARGWYRAAQRRDVWPGETYEGTSVLAGCLEGRARGLYDGFRWATRVEQLAAGIVDDGPAVAGVEWREGSYSTDRLGVLRPHGDVVGGHCVCLPGFVPADGLTGQLRVELDALGLLQGVEELLEDGEDGAFIGINSWGVAFGVRGLFAVALSEVRDWLRTGGEFAQPAGRRLPQSKGAAVTEQQQQEQSEQGPGDATLHITAAQIRDGDRVMDPPDGLDQDTVTVRGTPRRVSSWRGPRVAVDSTGGAFQLGASDLVTVRRSG